MNIPLETKHYICLRLYLGDINKAAIESDEGKKSIVLAICPRQDQPHGATHAAYQLVRGLRGEEHPVVGHAKFYRPDHIPAELQLDIKL